MKMVEMWPPAGGESVKVLEQNVSTMKGRGWKDKPPAKKARASAPASANPNDEDVNNG